MPLTCWLEQNIQLFSSEQSDLAARLPSMLDERIGENPGSSVMGSTVDASTFTRAEVNRMIASALTAAFAGIGGASSPTPGPAMPAPPVVPRVFQFTDPGQDVDDVSALAINIVHHRVGAIVLAAVICSPNADAAGDTTRALLDYAGLTSIPVATRKANDIRQNDYMDAAVAADYGYTAGKNSYPDPVPTVRALLSASPDKSVVFQCVGPVADVYDILVSSADAIDSRNGHDLILVKCQDFGLVFQGGQFDSARPATTWSDDFNFGFRCDAADFVIRNWPTKKAYAASSLADIPVGPLLAPLRGAGAAAVRIASGGGNYSVDLSNPLRAAHQEFQNGQPASITVDATRIARLPYDPIACSFITAPQLWALVRGTQLMDLTKSGQGAGTFTKDQTGNDFNMVRVGNSAAIAHYLNSLIDRYDQGATPPPRPAFTVSADLQVTLKIAISDPSFFTSYKYSTDGGETWIALPVSGEITTLFPARVSSLMFRGSRYGLNGPASDALDRFEPSLRDSEQHR